MNITVFEIQILLKFVPMGPPDNKTALIQVITWDWTADKISSEPMLTMFWDAIWLH